MVTKYDLRDIAERIFNETGAEIYFADNNNGIVIYSIDGLARSCIMCDYNSLYLVINNSFVNIGNDGKTQDKEYFTETTIKLINCIKLKQQEQER